jgi:hypothetical protein
MYAYCGNNPVMGYDPTGEFAISAIFIGALIGIGVQYLSDVIENVSSGEQGVDILVPNSSLTDYIAAAVGGAIASIPGTKLLGTLVTGAIGNVTSSALKGEIGSFSEFIKKKVRYNTENKSTGDRGYGNLSEGKAKSADTGDKNRRNDKEVSVFVKIYVLYHFKTRNSDKSVKCNTNAAHYAIGNRGKEGNEGAKEGNYHTHNCGCGDGDYRCVTSDSNTADRFAIRGVGASAKESACNRAYAVTQKCTMQAGIFQKISSDDGGKVLVIGNMLCKYNKRNGNVSHSHGCDKCIVDFLNTLECL